MRNSRGSGWSVVVGLLVLGVLVVFQAFAWHDGKVRWVGRDGDVELLNAGTTSVVAKPGTVVAYGVVVRNGGDEPVTLREVGLEGDVPVDQAVVVDTLVYEPRGNEAAGVVTWPDRRDARRTRPFGLEVVRPGEDAHLYVLVEVRGLGPGVFDRVVASYELDGRTVRVEAAGGLGFCSRARACRHPG